MNYEQQQISIMARSKNFIMTIKNCAQSEFNTYSEGFNYRVQYIFDKLSINTSCNLYLIYKLPYNTISDRFAFTDFYEGDSLLDLDILRIYIATQCGSVKLPCELEVIIAELIIRY